MRQLRAAGAAAGRGGVARAGGGAANSLDLQPPRTHVYTLPRAALRDAAPRPLGARQGCAVAGRKVVRVTLGGGRLASRAGTCSTAHWALPLADEALGAEAGGAAATATASTAVVTVTFHTCRVACEGKSFPHTPRAPTRTALSIIPMPPLPSSTTCCTQALEMPAQLLRALSRSLAEKDVETGGHCTPAGVMSEKVAGDVEAAGPAPTSEGVCGTVAEEK